MSSVSKPVSTNFFWQALAWFIDVQMWRRLVRRHFGRWYVFAHFEEGLPTALLTAALTASGWAVDERAGRVIARRTTPWGAGLDGSKMRMAQYRAEVSAALAAAGLPPTTAVECRIEDAVPDTVFHEPDWTPPGWVSGARRREMGESLSRVSADWPGYTATMPSLMARELPSGIPVRRVHSTAEVLRGASGATYDEVRSARQQAGFFFIAGLLMALAALPLPPRAFLVEVGNSVAASLPPAAPWVGASVVGLMCVAIIATPSTWVRFKQVVAALVLAVLGLVGVVFFAARSAVTAPDLRSLLWGVLAVAPVVLAGVLLAKVRANTWRTVLKVLAVVVISASTAQWVNVILGQSYFAGLGVWGWSTRLPFLGLVEALGGQGAMLLGAVLLLSMVVPLMAVMSPRLAGVCGLLLSLVVIITGAQLLGQPYTAGAELKAGRIAEGWGHVMDRACVVADSDKYPVDAKQPYWVFQGDGNRAILVPATATAARGPILLPLDGISVQPIGESQTCPAGATASRR